MLLEPPSPASVFQQMSRMVPLFFFVSPCYPIGPERPFFAPSLHLASFSFSHHHSPNAQQGVVMAERGVEVGGGTVASAPGALLNASRRGDVSVVTHLLQQKADPCELSPKGSFPLFAATKQGEHDIVELLLTNKADVNQVRLACHSLTRV